MYLACPFLEITMKFTQIIFDVTDKIATITLNRPEARNALAPQMRVELAEAMAHIKDCL